ncbi:SRPBCC domain-containing protein [Streptomyces sp. Z26]|uniref:SRPBCC domain-containing protein n=1 Tax=Streptomyces sp. Z26 TaxID=2500177 RepID=UPI000EF1504B|nr:SRPBCC domain-containing protein [Streptomyces sp. Z26]RLL67683.1 hypothetical protein D7M15_13465 [Streptomyces sp. Z26]
MEHEVYVPFPVGSVRAALAERTRVTRCVPGLQLAAAEGAGDAVEGRLRVRVGGSTITYRGRLRITAQGDGFTARGTGEEVRGSGTVKVRLKVVPRLADDGRGTRLVCTGKATGDGRLADLEAKVATAAGHRLLDRFAQALADSLRAETPDGATEPGTTGTPESGSGTTGAEAPAGDGPRPDGAAEAAGATGGIGEPDDNDRAIPGIPGPEKGDADRAGRDGADGTTERDGDRTSGEPPAGTDADAGTEAPAGSEADAETPSDTPAAPDTPEGADDAPAPGTGPTTGGVFDAEIPPPSLDPRADAGADTYGTGAGSGTDDDADHAGEATAEAAHARRTMIGRSAEEVDHAPPRGRYAPVPAPEDAAATATLRWAAPAAALVVAGAVVLGRALRRRR